MIVNPVEIVDFFWHSKDGVVPCDEFKTLDMAELANINRNNNPLNCDFIVNDENGGLRNVQPVVDVLKRTKNKKYFEYETSATIKNIAVQASTLYSMVLVHNEEPLGKSFNIGKDDESHLIFVNAVEEPQQTAKVPKLKVKESEPGFYANSVLLTLPECLKKQSKPDSFGEFCLYVVVRHQYVMENDDGTLVYNLFVSKEIDAVATIPLSDKNILVDLKVYSFSKLWNLETMNITNVRCLIMDFLVGGLAYVIGLRPKKEVLGHKDIHAKKIDKVMIFEKIRSICNSKTLKRFIDKLPTLVMNLADNFDPDQHLTLLKCKQQKKELLRFEEEKGSNLINLINIPETPKTYSFGFEPNLHHLVITGTTAISVPIDPPFWKCDFLSVETFCSRYFASFMYEPEKISIYGTKEKIDEVKKTLTEAEKSIATGYVHDGKNWIKDVPLTQKKSRK